MRSILLVQLPIIESAFFHLGCRHEFLLRIRECPNIALVARKKLGEQPVIRLEVLSFVYDNGGCLRAQDLIRSLAERASADRFIETPGVWSAQFSGYFFWQQLSRF